MSLHLYLNGGRQSMDGGSKGALGLPRERCKLNGLKIDQYDNYTGGYHLRPDWHWTYSFDGRGQVTGARKRTVTNVSTGAAFPLGGWDAAYSYEDIGNRTTSRFGGDGQESSPVGSEEVGYEVNALNQYTEIENPRAFFVTGSAPAASTVGITLNGTAANRAVPHFWARQEVAGTGPTWADATLVATSGSSTVTVPKHTYVPPAVETPQFDADGNLVSDGRWLYAWDGENRLKEMTAQAAAVLGGVPELRLSYAYDGQSRRIRKLVEEKVSGSWVTRTDTRFMYDGWNLMAEVEYLGTAPDAPPGTSVAPRPFLRRTYLWGQDLSGSLQGAGGVGGLLAITRHEHGAVPSKDYWATSDLNGNVIGLITETGLRALYEYDPFGKPLRVSEPEEDLNPFRFSTKYTDTETGLCYYGYRYYDAVKGRWINRDPIEERGGLNLYGMIDNSPVSWVDYAGLLKKAPSLEGVTGVKGAIRVSRAAKASAGLAAIGWIEIFDELLYQNYQYHHQAEGMPGVYQILRDQPRPIAATQEQHEDLENAVIATLDRGTIPRIWKLKRCEVDPATQCKIFWEGVDRGGYPPHTQYIGRNFTPPYGVVVVAPDGDWVSYDGGKPYGLPQAVFELKTGREWAGVLPMNMWAPIMHNIYGRDTQQFARQARIAMKCNLRYEIWIESKNGAAGYASKMPGYSIFYKP